MDLLLLLTSYSFNDCNFVTNFEIKEHDASSLLSFFRLFWLLRVFYGSIQILGLFIPYLLKILLEG